MAYSRGNGPEEDGQHEATDITVDILTNLTLMEIVSLLVGVKARFTQMM